MFLMTILSGHSVVVVDGGVGGARAHSIELVHHLKIMRHDYELYCAKWQRNAF